MGTVQRNTSLRVILGLRREEDEICTFM